MSMYGMRRSENAMRETLCETLRSYHNSHPYRYGMKKAEVHMTYLKKVKANVFDLYMELLVEKRCLETPSGIFGIAGV